MKEPADRRSWAFRRSADRREEDLLKLLQDGTLTLEGLLPWSSNYTFLGQVAQNGEQMRVVYKPIRGERPLWDFPRGTLAKREVAAYVVSRALRWDLVPPTVLRDGPHGRGSVQLFVEAEQDAHFFTFHEEPPFRGLLQELALFDIAVNNADRKGGHCLRLGTDRIVAIDHGICFNLEPKLRTVVWDFAGEPIPEELETDLRRFQAELADPDCDTVRQLRTLLTAPEVVALQARLAELLATGRFPDPPEDRRPYPWPLV